MIPFKNDILPSVLPSEPNQEHVSLQTDRKHYDSDFDSLRMIEAHDPPFHEDLPRLPAPNFYCAQEDALIDSLRNCDDAVTWSVHRPTTIFSCAPTSLMNIVGMLCIYAAICKHKAHLGDCGSLCKERSTQLQQRGRAQVEAFVDGTGGVV